MVVATLKQTLRINEDILVHTIGVQIYALTFEYVSCIRYFLVSALA